jgi:molybdopterin synthase catalytic subunit
VALPSVRLVDVRSTPLSLDEVFEAVRDRSAGGTVIFVGTVRDHAESRTVEQLDYSSHPSAADRMREVAEGIAAEPGVVAVAAVHRTGELAVGDIAVIVGVSAGHRAEAFTAGRRLIDEVKLEVPIWKHELFADGETAWVGG